MNFFDITRYNLQNIELEPVEINLSFMLEQLADEIIWCLAGEEIYPVRLTLKRI